MRSLIQSYTRKNTFRLLNDNSYIKLITSVSLLKGARHFFADGEREGGTVGIATWMSCESVGAMVAMVWDIALDTTVMDAGCNKKDISILITEIHVNSYAYIK